MGSFVRNFDDVQYKLDRYVPMGHLCCFFAFDDRPSLKGALEQLPRLGQWIDTLAMAANVFAFMPVSSFGVPTEHFFTGERSMTHAESEYLGSLPRIDYVLNPSIELAIRFGFLPSDLPAVILFRAKADPSRADACLIGIPEHAFRGDRASFEQFLSILFSELTTSLQRADRHDFSSIVAALQQLVTLGCSIKQSESVLGSPLAQALQDDLDSSRGRAYEPVALERIYTQIPEAERAKIKIFLSYASEDRGTVTAFHDRLSRAGFSPWMDSEDLLPGEKWDPRIQSVLRAADFVILFISHRSVGKRGYVQKELKDILRMCDEQLEGDIYLIPVKIDNCEVPASLASYQWLSFGCSDRGWEQLFKALAAGYARRRR